MEACEILVWFKSHVMDSSSSSLVVEPNSGKGGNIVKLPISGGRKSLDKVLKKDWKKYTSPVSYTCDTPPALREEVRSG